MKSIFIFLLCAITSFSANAQTSLSAKITDAKTGEALFAATVVLLKNGSIVTGAETDFDGKFSMTGLDAGTYDVRCTYAGMCEMLIKGYPVKAGRSNTLDIQMESHELGLHVIKNWNTGSSIQNAAMRTTLKGKVTDAKTGEDLFAANVTLIQNSSIIAGAETDFDGNYSINDLQAGLYSLRCTYTGTEEHLIVSFPISIDKQNRLDFQMESNAVFFEYAPIYCPPPLDLDNTTSGRIWTNKELRALPIK